MSIINYLITDRTFEDALEKNEKGSYNISDLNRVEEATQFIADLLTKNGYITTIVSKTNWTINDMPEKIEMARFLNNIKKCSEQFVKMNDLTFPKTMDYLNFAYANNFEKSFIMIEKYIYSMLVELILNRQCNDFECGEDKSATILARWDSTYKWDSEIKWDGERSVR